jgi:outer membrane immunogenic protein
VFQAASATPPSLYNWAGHCAGGHLGLGGSQDSTGIAGDTLALAALVSIGVIASSVATNLECLLTGLQFGCNYQRNKMVCGVEADSSFANIHGSGLVNTRAILPAANYTSTADQQIKWFATQLGRVGFTATDNLLLCGTGSLAVGLLDYSASVRCNANRQDI